MRRTSPLVRRSSDIDIDSAMTPMIDVVFLLLVFFVWTASFQIVEHILPSEMSTQIGSEADPDVESPPPKDIDDVVIRIGWNGQAPTWKINGDEVASLDEIAGQLKTILEIVANQPEGVVVILDPDSIVPLGHVIEAYDVAKSSGFPDISFAVKMQGL